MDWKKMVVQPRCDCIPSTIFLVYLYSTTSVHSSPSRHNVAREEHVRTYTSKEINKKKEKTCKFAAQKSFFVSFSLFCFLLLLLLLHIQLLVKTGHLGAIKALRGKRGGRGKKRERRDRIQILVCYNMIERASQFLLLYTTEVEIRLSVCAATFSEAEVSYYKKKKEKKYIHIVCTNYISG